MSKTPNFIRHHSRAGFKSCRVAYAINESQPVLCTIISDQPLFYMDFGIEEELEDHFDELFDVQSIEHSVAALQEKLSGKSDMEEFGFSSEESDKCLEIFRSDLQSVLSPFPGTFTKNIESLKKRLFKSRLARAYYDNLHQRGGEIKFSTQVEGAYYDREALCVYIYPGLTEGEQLLMAARELRRAWQHSAGTLIHPLSFHPDQAVLVNRAQIADLHVNMVRIAWELQLSGEAAAWNRLENSHMADLARALVRECYLDFRTLNNGLAASAVFETWFLSERCRHEDSKLIQLMLADFRGMVFDTAQSSQTVTGELIVALGSMPYGKNYLAPYAATIMADPVFTELRDRSNANFLWFIKFERSFRESEQGLQEDESHRDDLHEIFQNKHNKERFGDHEKEISITTIYGDTPENSGPSHSGSNVISFNDRRGDR